MKRFITTTAAVATLGATALGLAATISTQSSSGRSPRRRISKSNRKSEIHPSERADISIAMRTNDRVARDPQAALSVSNRYS